MSDRKKPVPAYYLEVLIPVGRAWSGHVLKPYKARALTVSPHLEDRHSEMSRRIVDLLPKNGGWYLAAITKSEGQARAMASAFVRGAYGPGIQASYMRNQDVNSRPTEDEDHHMFFVRRYGL